MKRKISLYMCAAILAYIVSILDANAAAEWDHVDHGSDVSAPGVCDGSFIVDANYSATGDFTVTYTFNGSNVTSGPYATPDDISISALCEGVYSGITITSISDGTTDVWPSNIVIADPNAPQPIWECDAKKYQSREVSGDYWLYEVETNPVNLTPLFNITAAGATDDLNSLLFNKNDGYMYIIQINAPHRLYRIGSDYTVVDLGPVSGFNSDAAVNAGAENDNGDMIFRDTRNQDFYLLDLTTMIVNKLCDFSVPSGMDSNIGDFAYNPANGLYYGTRDDSDNLAVLDFDNCTETHITMSDVIMSALGAFWIGADGKGYGYANADGTLYQIDLTTGDLAVIGQGESTSQTDGCSCEGISFHKEVDIDTTVEGDTVIYTITIYNNWQTHLSTVLFRDDLCSGMTWASEPFDKTGGIVIGATAVTGDTRAEFTIDQIPQGTCTFSICAKVSIPYTGDDPCMSQATIDNLPPGLGAARFSDNPRSAAIDDPTPLKVISVNDCSGDYNLSTVDAKFSWNYLAVEASATKPLQNVVLQFSDGTTETFSDMALDQYRGTFIGTGDNSDKCIVGLWIRTACNASGEGPEYGVYQANRYWDGICVTDDVPVIEADSDHGSTVLFGNGPALYDWSGSSGNTSGGTGSAGGSGSHGSSGTGIEQPEIPGRDRTINLPESDFSVYPNPARATTLLKVKGLDTGEWTLHIYTVSGRYINAQSVQANGEINIAQLNLVSGIYLLQFENGLEQQSFKLIIHE